MDELLPYPHRPLLAPTPVRRHTSAHRRFSLPRLRLDAIPDFVERRSPLDPAIFLAVALSLTASGVLGHLYVPSYQVTVDGADLGPVASYHDVEAAIGRVEARASDILGYDYTLTQQVEYSFHVSRKDLLGSVDQVETYLFDQIGEVMKTSVLSISDHVIGAADDTQALWTMLDTIKAPYVNENTLSASFVEPVAITREYTPTADIVPISHMQSILTSNSMEQMDYVVQAGDTFSGIANRYGMTTAELLQLNPGLDVDSIQIGQILTLRHAVPFLSVRTIDLLTYDGPLAFSVEEIPDDTLYQGDTKVLTPGVDGYATFTAHVTYLNGEEQSRTIQSTDVHLQPVTQVVAVGTKPRPKTMATGHFRWPLSGTITSGFGSRYIFGSYSFHSGLDIAAPYGTAIAAADGGVVVFAGAGTGNNWSYGNFVMIDHENGLRTIYAHCSSLNVRAGERVYQGQVIARVGSTGRSTGNHCHFQVKSNGTTVNPYNYLP